MRTKLILLATMLVACAAPAWAQPTDRTVVAFSVGAATGEQQTGGVFGGTVLVNVNEWVAIEGNGTYFDRGSGADAVNFGGSVMVNLVASRARGVPYVAFGGSVHHATFDLSDERFVGNRNVPFAPGATVCTAPGAGAGPGPMQGWGVGNNICPANMAGYLGVGELPRFYGNRLGMLQVPMNGVWDDRSFTDPALTLGGGVRINLTDRLMLRPDLSALMIFGDGDTETLGVFVVHLGYRF